VQVFDNDCLESLTAFVQNSLRFANRILLPLVVILANARKSLITPDLAGAGQRDDSYRAAVDALSLIPGKFQGLLRAGRIAPRPEPARDETNTIPFWVVEWQCMTLAGASSLEPVISLTRMPWTSTSSVI
jgi:hypothetical protein